MTGIAAFLSVSLGAVTIGCLFGCVTAVVTRYTNEVRVVEPLAVIGLAYMAYLTAELVHFSGIIAIICCGLVQVSRRSKTLSLSKFGCKYLKVFFSCTSNLGTIRNEQHFPEELHDSEVFHENDEVRSSFDD